MTKLDDLRDFVRNKNKKKNIGKQKNHPKNARDCKNFIGEF